MMEHSAKFEKVKRYYEAGIWTKEMVRNAAKNPKNNPWITGAEAEKIIGDGTGLAQNPEEEQQPGSSFEIEPDGEG